jgi:hypothetical protein
MKTTNGQYQDVVDQISSYDKMVRGIAISYSLCDIEGIEPTFRALQTNRL